MKNILLISLVISLIALINSQFVELAYKFGFAELKMVAVLENKQKMKVKCDAYALGFFDEIKIQNNFQKCINDYTSEGYQVVSQVRG